MVSVKCVRDYFNFTTWNFWFNSFWSATLQGHHDRKCKSRTVVSTGSILFNFFIRPFNVLILPSLMSLLYTKRSTGLQKFETLFLWLDHLLHIYDLIDVYLYLKILLTETGIWAFVSDKKKSLKVGRLKFMQVIRRVIRFSGKSTFLYTFIYFHYL